MADDRQVGGLEKLVGKVMGGLEWFTSPVTKHAPQAMKSLYNGGKNILLQYVCGTVDKAYNGTVKFAKEHPVLTGVGVAAGLVGILAFPYLLGYASYSFTALGGYTLYPLFHPYMI